MPKKVKVEKMKERLLLERNELIKKNSEAFVIDIDGDETDEIQGNMILELGKQLSSRDMEKIKLINSSLAKIKDGIYGICEDCGENIPEKRLNINPYFTTCVLCAEDREKELKGKRN